MSTHDRKPADVALLRHQLNRRRFLSMLGGAGALGVTACGGASLRPTQNQNESAAPAGAVDDNSLPVQPSSEPPERRRPAHPNRKLVVIEMSGGNDGLAMLQPYGASLLAAERPQLITADEELIDAGSGFGWHPRLADVAKLGMVAAVGIGSLEPDYSHFEMEQRWWSGVSSENGRANTGFFGRLCDELDVGDPVTGLSFSGGPSPALSSNKAVTVGLADPGASWFFREDDDWYQMLRSTYGAMAEPSANDTAPFVAARAGLDNTLRFAESISEVSADGENTYPWSNLGQQLRFAAEILSLDVGMRVVHVRQDGFDTHTGQQWRHPELMGELNDALLAFMTDLEQRGELDDTLIVTTSEFGRRVAQNDGGTDHGGASTMMVCQPGHSGVHGEAPNLRKLDDGNVIATARFEDYYATISQDWFGDDPDLVLPSAGTPISGLILA